MMKGGCFTANQLFFALCCPFFILQPVGLETTSWYMVETNYSDNGNGIIETATNCDHTITVNNYTYSIILAIYLSFDDGPGTQVL